MKFDSAKRFDRKALQINDLEVAHRAGPFPQLPVPRQYRGRARIIDVGVAARHSTGDARRLPDGRCGPSSLVDAQGPPARESCPAPPVERPRSFESALCPSDRLLWLLLRWLWPRWREALVLVQPATVDRWHREGFRRCWRRHSRRPGRPRIDSPCRDLIRRVAAENCLWGAPRIHGELLKLGIAVSERTVSRYLRGRPTTRSQTWRTFLANHLGNETFGSLLMSSDADGNDVVVDASDLSFRAAPLSLDASCASVHWRRVDWPRSFQHMSRGVRLAQDHVHDRTGRRTRSSRDPPGTCGCNWPHGVQADILSSVPAVPLRPRTA